MKKKKDMSLIERQVALQKLLNRGKKKIFQSVTQGKLTKQRSKRDSFFWYKSCALAYSAEATDWYVSTLANI